MDMIKAHEVLIIEDDQDLRESLKIALSPIYQVFTSPNGIEGVEVAKTIQPSIILLDILMPNQNGFDTISVLRNTSETVKIPILMMSVISTSPDRVRAFNLGADDFLVKPFGTDELLARVASKIRLIETLSSKTSKKNFLKCGNLKMDLESLEVTIANNSIQLSYLEFCLLKYFIKHINKLRTRRQILDAVWKSKDASERILDPHIMLIRRKLIGFDHEISSIYGGGYILRPLRIKPTSLAKTETEMSI